MANRSHHRKLTLNEAHAIGSIIVHKTCLLKRPFDSEALAKSCQHDQKAYRCQFCGKWHLSGAANTRRNNRRNTRKGRKSK